MAKKIPRRDYPPPELQKQMWERYQELKRTYPGKLPQGASQFTYKGNVFTVKPNSKAKGRFQVKSADVDRLAANTRRGTKLTLLEYVNHPRYAGDPELATQMYEYDRQQLKRYGQRSSRANQLDHIDPVKGDVRKGVEHYRNKLLLGADDNALKSNKVPSDSTLEYMGIGRTPEEMVDRAASSPYPRQTPRDKRLMLQGDLDIDFKKGMGLAPSGGVLLRNISAVHVFIAEKLMNYMNLHLITFILVLLGVKTSHRMSYQRVPAVIRTKEAQTGALG